MTDKRKHNGRQPYDAADKRSQRVDSYYNPSELELLNKAQAVEMPGKPRGAYVRYAALQHALSVDISTADQQAETWYYYHKDKYGREVCYKLNGLAVRSKRMQSKVTDYTAADYQITPAMYNADDITPAAAQRRKMYALAALLRAEADKQ